MYIHYRWVRARVYRAKMWSVKCGMYILMNKRTKWEHQIIVCALRVENRNQLHTQPQTHTHIHMRIEQYTYRRSLPLVNEQRVCSFYYCVCITVLWCEFVLVFILRFESPALSFATLLLSNRLFLDTIEDCFAGCSLSLYPQIECFVFALLWIDAFLFGFGLCSDFVRKFIKRGFYSFESSKSHIRTSYSSIQFASIWLLFIAVYTIEVIVNYTFSEVSIYSPTPSKQHSIKLLKFERHRVNHWNILHTQTRKKKLRKLKGKKQLHTFPSHRWK